MSTLMKYGSKNIKPSEEFNKKYEEKIANVLNINDLPKFLLRFTPKVWVLSIAIDLLFLIIGILFMITIGKSSGWSTITKIFWAIFFIGAIFLIIVWFVKSRKKSAITNQGFQDPNVKALEQEMYKEFFDKHYTNLKIVGIGDVDRALKLIYKNRPQSIPSDARIISPRQGYIFKINETEFEVNAFAWRWTRSNGKTTVTYTRPELVVNFLKINDAKFGALNFSLKKDGIFTKNKLSMTNEEFSKKWNYKNNNAAKIRMALTPFVQEKLLDRNNFFYQRRSEFIFVKVEGKMAMSFKYKNDDIFQIGGSSRASQASKIDFNLTGDSLRRSVAKNYLKDFEFDIIEVENLLQEITLFKSFF